MSFHVHIQHCTDDSYWTAHADDLEKRLAAKKEGLIRGNWDTIQEVAP
jgi:predicted GIY-YIG superfamily endonuclease